MQVPPLRLVAAATLCLLVFHGFGAGAIALPTETTERSWNDHYAVPLDDVGLDRLEAVIATTDAALLRVDERLGFAVVTTEDPALLQDLLAVELQPDAASSGDWTPNDPYYPYQWALSALDMAPAWDLERGDRSVWVAVVDSGVDMDHADLEDTPFRTGLDYVDPDLDPSDTHGHGTHVAGTIAADTDNGRGVAGMADVGLIVIRVLDGYNQGSCLNMASGIAEAAALGADVINLSLHCGSFPLYLSVAIKYALDSGTVLVAAAGNYGQSAPVNCVVAPARHSGVLAVGAVDESLDVADFSCRGPEVEFVAPGVDVVSTVPWYGYGSWSGTSMAAPHVSALAALLLSHADLGAEEVRSAMQVTAQDLGSPGRDPDYGYGLIQPEAALRHVV